MKVRLAQVFDGSSPRAGGLEGHGSHTVGVSPQGSASLSPVQSGHLLPLEPFLGQKQALRACSSVTKPFLFCTAPVDSDLPEGMTGMRHAGAARLRFGAKSEPELQRWETLGTNPSCGFGTPFDRWDIGRSSQQASFLIGLLASAAGWY